jgi:aquaporin Z
MEGTMNTKGRIFAAELIGTMVLMIGGPGSAILAAEFINGALGVSLAFGFSLLVMAYAIGHVSGCHINPAVTVAMALAKKLEAKLVALYIVAQLAGAAIGGLVIWAIRSNDDAFDATNNFAANGWGDKIGSAYGLGAVVIVEIVFTALLIFVVLSTTSRGFTPGMGGLTAGITLALIHLVTIPVDNTSVNPARSFGTAIFSGGDALGQLWAFIVFPVIGAVVGVLAWLAVDESRLEDTMLGDNAQLKGARDSISGVVDKGIDKL